jgi:hypothetical protein
MIWWRSLRFSGRRPEAPSSVATTGNAAQSFIRNTLAVDRPPSSR